MRLIDADVLQDGIEEWIDTVGNVTIGKGLSYYGELQGCIEECPTIDAEPVRHGRWIEKPFLLGISNFCSLCGENYGMPHGKFKYCPNCGAKMDGKVMEDDKNNE